MRGKRPSERSLHYAGGGWGGGGGIGSSECARYDFSRCNLGKGRWSLHASPLHAYPQSQSRRFYYTLFNIFLSRPHRCLRYSISGKPRSSVFFFFVNPWFRVSIDDGSVRTRRSRDPWFEKKRRSSLVYADASHHGISIVLWNYCIHHRKSRIRSRSDIHGYSSVLSIARSRRSMEKSFVSAADWTSKPDIPINCISPGGHRLVFPACMRVGRFTSAAKTVSRSVFITIERGQIRVRRFFLGALIATPVPCT